MGTMMVGNNDRRETEDPLRILPIFQTWLCFLVC